MRPLALLLPIFLLPALAGANSITRPNASSNVVDYQQLIPLDPVMQDFSLPGPVVNPFSKVAPRMSAAVAQRALDAMACAQDKAGAVEKLIVVDMAMPAKAKRLWAFDVKDPDQPRLVLNDRVAHGSGSDRNGDGRPEAFSNLPNSHMTSLGLYKIAERYQGKNGWSRRLDGFFSLFNSNARSRVVVLHPSTYVRADHVGRSQGCPAVSQETMDALEQAGLKHAVLWIDGPDQALAKQVADCSKKHKQRLAALARGQMPAWANNAFVSVSWEQPRHACTPDAPNRLTT